jgi:electron transport complex protein RnfG
MTEDSNRPSDVTSSGPVPPPPAEEAISSARMITAMGAIGTLSAVLLVFTYITTLPAIERNRAEALERAIFQVLPGAGSKQTFAEVDGRLQPVDDNSEAMPKYYAGYDQHGTLVGVALPAEGQGFQDILKVLYGYSPDCSCIVGFKVLESKETPGLGDKIETDPAFTANFEALDVSLDASLTDLINPLELVKPGQKTDAWQVEGITGATISARAVTRILRESSSRVVTTIEHNLEELKGGNPDELTAENH